MKRLFPILIAFIIVTLLNAPEVYTQTNNMKVPVIEKKTVEYWMNYLASDSMMGRRNGSQEMKKAAEWLAAKFKEFGLKPLKGNDGFIQHYYIKMRNDSLAENNVVGYIEGSDPVLKNEYIVITAHFDHVGVRNGLKPDSILNGANDNASGTGAVMGVAKTLQLMKARPERSIIFAAVSGEEMGIKGSRYLVSHLPFPIENIYLNINFEMLGHCSVLGEKRYMITGPDNTNLKEILNEYNKAGEWKLIDTVKNLAGLFFASDNAAFAGFMRKDNISYGVPAHTFVIHNGDNPIHHPSDEAKYFNFDNYRNFIQYMSGLTLDLASSAKKIEWTSSRFKMYQKN